MKIFLQVLFLSSLFAQVVDLSRLESGKRGDYYRLWVYFDERDQNKTIELDHSSISRREKHGIYKPTKYDYLIKSFYIDEVKKTGVEIKNKSRWLNAISIIADEDQIFQIRQYRQ